MPGVAGTGEAGSEALGTEPRTIAAPDVREHLVTLDSLRGIAIWAVVTHHMLSHWQGALGPVEVPRLGWDAVEFLHVIPGVPLFYLLSGYLLTWTEGSRARRGSYSLASYAKRRALRIVPAYYVAIAVVLLLWPRPPPSGTSSLTCSSSTGSPPTTAARCPRRSGL
jgi:peptidoglycan/LPS O-acetylase OafA/YrhL